MSLRSIRVIGPSFPHLAAPLGVIAPSTYIGPGDISGMTAASSWWGLRAYSLASIGAVDVVTITYNDTVPITYRAVTGGVLPWSTIAAHLGTHGAPGKVTKLWDQVGTNHFIPYAGTIGPAIVVGPPGAMQFTGVTGIISLLGTNLLTVSNPFSYSTFFNNAGTGVQATLFGFQDNPYVSIGFRNSADNEIFLYSGSVVSRIAADTTDGVWRSVQVAWNAGSTDLNIDGTSHTGINPGSSTVTDSLLAVAGIPGAGQEVNGKICEFGFWASSALTPTQMGQLSSNAHTFWGV